MRAAKALPVEAPKPAKKYAYRDYFSSVRIVTLPPPELKMFAIKADSCDAIVRYGNATRRVKMGETFYAIPKDGVWNLSE